MIEQWRPVAGHEGWYEVSNNGRVRSVKRSVQVAGGWTRHYRSVELSANITKNGYPTVRLARGGRKVTRAVHVLVCEAFHGPRTSPNHVARHANGIKTDNRADNLSWGTYTENAIDRVIHGADHNASKTHCHRGHEFTPDNTRISRRTGGGRTFSRQCRQCERINLRRSRARKKAA